MDNLAKNEFSLPTDKERIVKAFTKPERMTDWLTANQTKVTIKFHGDRHALITYMAEQYEIEIKETTEIVDTIADQMIGTEYKDLRYFIIYNPKKP